MKVLKIVLLGILVFNCHLSNAALHEGLYIIENQDDGSFLESNNHIVPNINEKNQVRTAPRKNIHTGQRWNLIALGSDKYALVNELNPNNEVGKAAHGEEGFPDWAHFSLIPVGSSDVFLIQKLRFSSYRGRGRLQNACLLNQGAGQRVAFFARCEAHSSNQKWRFIKI